MEMLPVQLVLVTVAVFGSVKVGSTRTEDSPSSSSSSSTRRVAVAPGNSCPPGDKRCQLLRNRDAFARNFTRNIRLKSVIQKVLTFTNMTNETIPNQPTIDPVTLETILANISETPANNVTSPTNTIKVTGIVSFAEEADEKDEKDVIQFRLNTSASQLLVDNATMWVRVRVSKRKSRSRTRNPRVKLTVYHLSPRTEPTAIAYVRQAMKRTDWVTFNIPGNIIQDAINNSEHIIRFRLFCDCGRGVTPIMARRERKRSKNQKAPQNPNKRDVTQRASRKTASGRKRSRPTRSRPRHLGRRRKRLPSQASNPPKGKKLNRRRPFLFINTRPLESTRRSTITKRSLDCPDKPKSCCTRSLYVDFRALGWDKWILMPKGYMANYCDGSCGLVGRGPMDSASPHASVLDHYHLATGRKERSAQASCCSPTKLLPLSLLYVDHSGNIIKSDLPNMIVGDCGCA